MSFPRYPAYKDSGVEWLGEVPEHWNRTALKFLADYQNGYPFKPEDRGQEGLPIIRISQLTGDDEPAYYSGNLDERVKVRDGDLLFTWSATIDSFIWDKGEAWLNQHIFRVSPSAETDKRYMYYVIKHVAPKLADFDAHGSTMRHIKKESLGEKVYVPSVRDQGLIATFLDHETAKIDALIAEQQRLIELLQEKRQAVISHAVTKGLNPHAPVKDSGVEWLGEVPEHWEVLPIKYTCSLLRDGTHLPPTRVAEGIPLLSVRNIQGHAFGLRDDDSLISEQDYLELSRSFVPEPDDVMLAIVGATMGKAAIVPSCIGRFHIQRSLAIFRSKPELLVAKWLLGVIGSIGFNSLLWQNVGFSAQPGIYLGVLKDIRIPVPPKKEQEEILARLDESINDQSQILSVASHSVGLLQERRSALISAAVTGQIDVRGLVPEAVAA